MIGKLAVDEIFLQEPTDVETYAQGTQREEPVGGERVEEIEDGAAGYLQPGHGAKGERADGAGNE